MIPRIMIHISFAFMLLIEGCVPSKRSLYKQVPEPDYWPTEGWQRSPLEAPRSTGHGFRIDCPKA